MLNNKRSRSKSKDGANNKKQRIECNTNLLYRTSKIQSSLKVVCKFCERDITKTIKILCTRM